MHCSIQVHPLMQFYLSFTLPCSNRLNCYPPTEKNVSADGNSLGPVGEVHLKFQVGKI